MEQVDQNDVSDQVEDETKESVDPTTDENLSTENVDEVLGLSLSEPAEKPANRWLQYGKTLFSQLKETKLQHINLFIFALATVILANFLVRYFFEHHTLTTNMPTPLEQIQKRVDAIRASNSDRALIQADKVDDASLRPLMHLQQVTTLILEQGSISDVGAKVLATLPRLEHLRIHFSELTDAGLETLSTCKNLRILSLPNARCSSEGLKALGKLPHLSYLRIGSKDADRYFCKTLSEIHSLRILHITNVPVNDANLKLLVTLPHLESLYLDRPEISENGWDWLFRHYAHLHVHIGQAHHKRDPHWHAHGTKSLFPVNDW